MSKAVIRFTAQQELRALPILLRHSSGTMLPERTYVISVGAADALRKAGIKFTTIGSEANAPTLKGAATGERV
jgi:hypothetical protein